MTKILIVDDNKSIRRILSDILKTRNYDLYPVASGSACLSLITQDKFDIILLDIQMQEMDGFEVLERLNMMRVRIPVIMMSAFGRKNTADKAKKMGAFDYIQKPFDTMDLLKMIDAALERGHLKNFDIAAPGVHPKSKISKPKLPKMIGSCPRFMLLKADIARFAPSEFGVLIEGPNGAGKELVAQQIHELSPRRNKPFVEVNCAAIPQELIESILFGHTKGSFTGAGRETVGLFQQAEGGTIFLDEIGDMPYNLQAKMLRVLQENRITKVGGSKKITVNVRVVAATNQNLAEMIFAKKFRKDLYYRLEELVIKVPSLNERRADIPELVNYFNETLSARTGKAPKIMEREAMNALQQLNYPGNIRQLQNIVKRLLVRPGNSITVQDVNQSVPLIVSQQKGLIEAGNLIRLLGGVEATINFIKNNFKQ